MSETPSTWCHYNPVRIENALLDDLTRHVTADHVLLVTTSGFVRRGVVQRIKNILAPRKVTVWDGVMPNPDLRDLDLAVRELRQLNVGCILGVGGGSSLDAAKVLATMIPSHSDVSLINAFRLKAPTQWNTRLPLVVIPTTSGTGSEVTPFATIWDHEQHKKHSLTGDHIYPDVALLDATLTLTLGEEDTLYPALDTISHALESLWNKNRTPVSRAYAFQALALCNNALPLVMKDPQNLKERQHLQSASVLAGLAISQTKTAIAHSISYPLTTHFGMPHGLACSFMLPYLIQINLPTLARDLSEKIVLATLLNLIKELDLNERTKSFASTNEMISRVNEMITKERIENYDGEFFGDLVQVISR